MQLQQNPPLPFSQAAIPANDLKSVSAVPTFTEIMQRPCSRRGLSSLATLADEHGHEQGGRVVGSQERRVEGKSNGVVESDGETQRESQAPSATLA